MFGFLTAIEHGLLSEDTSNTRHAWRMAHTVEKEHRPGLQEYEETRIMISVSETYGIEWMEDLHM